MMKKHLGFSMVELMIVIAIIGVLAGVGYPAYIDAVNTGKRADAIDAMLATAGRMEEYYMNNDTYAVASVTALMGTNQSPEGLYTMSFGTTVPTAFYYQIVATPNQTDAECTTLTLDSVGTKGSTGTATVCW